MTVAGRSGKAEDMESWEVTTTGSEKRPEDELESDVDHKEMINAYACDSYLSRWLPDIKDEQRMAENHISTSHRDKIKQEQEQGEKRCIMQQGSNSIKSTSQNRQQQETVADDSRDIKVPQESRKKTYFEAIKCSPMKLRRSIVNQKRPKTENGFAVKQHPGDQMDETAPTAITELVPSVDELTSDHPDQNGNQVNPATHQDSSMEDKKSMTKNTMIPCIVEMTGDPLGQLGSLCFKSEDAERRRSDVAYSSCHMAGGKTHKIHRSSRKTITRNKNNNELLVRCESVMIYPKILVNPRTEKPPSKPLYPREAWLEDGLRRPSLSSKPDEDYTRLPDLGATENVISQNSNDQKLSPERARSPPQKPRANSQNSQRSASTKIIIPFGEGELKLTNEKNPKSEKQLDQKPEDLKALETKSSQIKDVSNNEQNSKKNRRYFNDSKKTCHPNFPETPRRKISGMIIGITQLETPKRNPLITQHLTFAHHIYPVPPRPPIKRIKYPTTDANELFLGRENLAVTRNSPRYTYNQRKRLDISRKCNHHTPSQLFEDEHEGSRYFLSNDGNLSLTIGGTGLFKEQRSLHENFEGGKHIDDADKKRVHFSVLLPHSRYFT